MATLPESREVKPQALDEVAHGARETAVAVVNGLADAAALLDENFRPLHYNYAWALMTGLKRRELDRRLTAGATSFELLDGKERPLLEAATRVLSELREMRLDALPILNAASETVNVVATLVPLRDPTHRLVGVLQVMRDITAEVRVQEKYKEMLALEKVRADQLEREVEARTLDLRAALEQVTRMSRTDPLTGLLNRRAFTEMANHALQMAGRYHRNLAVIVCDLDFFKKMNDTHGHQAGDTVLVSTAQALTSAVRSTDGVARFGGEEFIILLTETNEGHVMEVAERCHQRVRQMPVQTLIPGVTKPQTVSVGAAIFPTHGTTLDELTKNADRALYKAKRDGRDRVVVFDDSIGEVAANNQPAQRKVLLVSDSEQRLASLSATLEGKYELLTATKFGRGLDAAVRGMVDVLVADQELEEDRGPEFLGASVTVLPDALRVLLTPTKDSYARVRKTVPATVDLFILTDEATHKLEAAIEDGLAQRQVSHARGPRFPVTRVPEEALERLDQLVKEGALRLHFQPILELKSRTVRAYEALSRVDEPSLSNPEVLFDTAVASGRIWQLSRLVRQRAAEQMHRMAPGRKLFVNLHPAEVEDPQLLEDPLLRPWAPHIVFEITERAALPDYARFKARMKQLREAGYRFAVDDLGAGYASLNSVALLEPDFVKIDRLTVNTLATNPRLRTLVRRVVEYADDAGIQVVGEGVEKLEEVQALEEVGCHLVQGYYFGRPGPDIEGNG